MKTNKSISFVAAVCIGISSFAAFEAAASADTGFSLSSVVTAKDFTLVSNENSTDKPFLQSDKLTELTETAAYKSAYKKVFGDNFSKAGNSYVNWFGTSRRGVVSTRIMPTAEELGSGSYWTAYALLVGGTVAPTITISDGETVSVDNAAMTAVSAECGTAMEGSNSKKLYIASCELPKDVFKANTEYTVTWGGSTPSDIAAAGFGPSGIEAQPDTIYMAADLFSRTNSETGFTLKDNTSAYTNAGSPFGDLETVANGKYNAYASGSCGSPSLRFDGLKAGSYTLDLLVMEYNNRYCNIYLDDSLISDGSQVSGLKVFANSLTQTSRGIAVEQIPIDIVSDGTHMIKIESNNKLVGIYAAVLSSPAKPEFSGDEIIKGSENDKLTSGKYERFSTKSGDIADAYMTSIDFSQYSAEGLRWIVTNTDGKTAVAGEYPAITDGTVSFGLIITGSEAELDSIASVELK